MIPVNPDPPKEPAEPEKKELETPQEPTPPQTPPAGERWLSAEEFEEVLRHSKQVRILVPPKRI